MSDESEQGKFYFSFEPAMLEELLQSPDMDVTYQSKKGFKKCIGQYRNAQGELCPKIFWFGHDRPFARRLARIIWVYHKYQQKAGMREWTPETLLFVADLIAYLKKKQERVVNGMLQYLAREGKLPSQPVPLPVAADTGAPLPLDTPLPKPTSRRVHAAMDKWLEHLEQRQKSGDISDDYVSRARCSVRNLKMAIPDQPLESVGTKELDTCRLWYQVTFPTNGGRVRVAQLRLASNGSGLL